MTNPLLNDYLWICLAITGPLLALGVAELIIEVAIGLYHRARPNAAVLDRPTGAVVIPFPVQRAGTVGDASSGE